MCRSGVGSSLDGDRSNVDFDDFGFLLYGYGGRLDILNLGQRTSMVLWCFNRQHERNGITWTLTNKRQKAMLRRVCTTSYESRIGEDSNPRYIVAFPAASLLTVDYLKDRT